MKSQFSDNLFAVCRDDTYLLHLEVMNLLLVMLSTQLFSPSATAEAGAHPFTEVLMDGEEGASGLVLLLLKHFIERRPLPANAPVFKPPSQQQRGVLRFVRSAAGILICSIFFRLVFQSLR